MPLRGTFRKSLFDLQLLPATFFCLQSRELPSQLPSITSEPSPPAAIRGSCLAQTLPSLIAWRGLACLQALEPAGFKECRPVEEFSVSRGASWLRGSLAPSRHHSWRGCCVFLQHILSSPLPSLPTRRLEVVSETAHCHLSDPLSHLSRTHTPSFRLGHDTVASRTRATQHPTRCEFSSCPTGAV